MNFDNNDSAESRAKRIKLLVLDVDGVLTDGGLYYTENGLIMKRFHVHDGIGMRIAMQKGIEIAVISGMDVAPVRKRIEDLGIREYHGGPDNKRLVLDEMRTRLGLEWQEIAYLGDDWVDLAPMKMVGLPAAVANATQHVKKIAKYVTTLSGGNGAVREFIEFLLICQDKYDSIIDQSPFY